MTSTGSPDKVIKDFVRACISGVRALPITLAADRAGTAIAEQSRLQNLGTEVERICQAYGLGERWTLDADNKCFVLDTYAGTDRTQGNTADNPPCIFAAKYRNLADYEYDWDGSGRQTTAIVAGQGEGADREIITVGGTVSGVDRCEVFVDARDVARGDTALLTERGTAAIIDAAESIITEESQNGNLVFGTDYDLGDVVTVRITVPEYKLEDGYYDTVDRQILINQRITEAIITAENGEYNVDLKYGEQQVTRAQTLTQDVQRLKADAPADAGDYIVERAVTGSWTYRKYASGDVVMEYGGNLTFPGMDDASGAGVDGYYMAAVDVELPVTLAHKYCVPVCSVDWTYAEWVQAGILDTKHIKIRKFANGNGINNTTNYVSIVVHGKWK